MSILAALLVVTSTGSYRTHLVASSPAIAGTRPDRLPPKTLCGRQAGLLTVTHPVPEVGCCTCLINAMRYLELPSWRTTDLLPPAHPSTNQ